MNSLAIPCPSPLSRAPAHRLGRMAIAALHAELACSPKPGLVTPFSRGSHHDMDAGTFMRSLFALRGYFVAIAAQGPTAQRFASLRQLGLSAEQAMGAATGGINTHRGAIFSLGLLVAHASRLYVQQGRPAPAEAVCADVARWRDDLLDAPLDPRSPGQRARSLHGVAGVREQAAAGFPLLQGVGVPALRAALADGLDPATAHVQTLMQLIAVADDLNLLHRGGREGLAFAQASAREFLASGGVHAAGWSARLRHLGHAFEQRRLSPGGSADLLACSVFLLMQERMP